MRTIHRKEELADVDHAMKEYHGNPGIVRDPEHHNAQPDRGETLTHNPDRRMD
jgi:hypothetical protein